MPHPVVLLLVGLLGLLPALHADSSVAPPAPATLGLLADSGSREIEDLLRLQLQKEPDVVLLERTELALLGRELSLHDLLARPRWDGCELLVQLQVFESSATPRERQLLVRLVATRTLQARGLWVYPLASADPEGLVSLLAPRVSAELADFRAGQTPPRTVSLSLLRGDTPALDALAEAATYALAARLQDQPGVVLLERWNVRDPGFEQWLLQHTPMDLRPPDLLVHGSVSEFNGGPGLRLSINDVPQDFMPATVARASHTSSALIELAASSAAQAIANAAAPGLAKGARTEEIRRFESEARWFWKWRAFDRAASAAETAVYLGSRDLETLHLRSLCDLGLGQGFLHGTAHTVAPDDRALQNLLRGLDRFSTIPAPPPEAGWQDRWRHLFYSAHALRCAGAFLQGMYFSDLPAPGFPEDHVRLRDQTHVLALRASAYATLDHRFPQTYTRTLEHLPRASDAAWFDAVLSYAGFWTDDIDDLARQYSAALEACARAGSSPAHTDLPGELFRTRALGHHYPIIVDWRETGLPATDAAQASARLVSELTASPRPEIRLVAAFLPLGRTPPGPKAALVPDQRTWLRWSFEAIARDEKFLAAEPGQYSFQVLSFIGEHFRRLRAEAPAAFPEVDWRATLDRLIRAAPQNPRSTYAAHTVRFLAALRAESLANNQAEATPLALPDDDAVGAALARFLVASPPASAESRKARALVAAQATLRPPGITSPAGRAEPALRLETPPNVLLRAATPAPLPTVLAPARLFPDVAWGDSLSAASAPGGNLWLLYHDFRRAITRFVEIDAAVTRPLRVVAARGLLKNLHNARPHLFVATGSALYIAEKESLHEIVLPALSLRSFALPTLGEPSVWLADEELWIAGAPGIVLRLDRKEQRVRLVASSMRTPATNALDARDAYQVSSIFAHEGATYAWVDNRQLYQIAPGRAAPRELYSTRAHLNPGAAYPATLLIAGVGASAARYSYEPIVDVLVLDPAMRGVLAPHTRTQPARLRMPDGTELFANELLSAAADQRRLWLLHRSKRAELVLGTYQRGAGTGTSRTLQFPPRTAPDRIYRVAAGLLFQNQRQAWFFLSVPE